MEWAEEVKCFGLSHLEEVITLDSNLCPSVVDFTDDDRDWDHLADQDDIYGMFEDLDYLLKRIEGIAPVNILAAVRNPQADCKTEFPNPRFTFKGYDLVDPVCSIGALTDCGGFPGVFQNEELSNVGLISDFTRAQEIQASLLEHYPDEPHAKCDVWAIWRMEK